MSKSFIALTTKEIYLPLLTGEFKRVPLSTNISVDVVRSVAFWEGYHFDVFPDEYIVLT